MDILNTLSLKSNRQIKINFDEGDLSSDAGLLLIQEFAAKMGLSSFLCKFLEKILWGGEPPLCRTGRFKAASY